MSVPFANSYWVVPGQFLAGEHPSEVDEHTTLARLTALLNAGVRTFVDLTEDHELPSYARLLRNVAEGRRIDITLVRIPIRDRGIPSEGTLRCTLDLIDRSIATGNPVFLHCFAGLGRTGTVVGCHLKRHRIATAHDVMTKIAELRRLMPSGREASPQTPEQERIVRSWQDGSP